MKHTKNLGDEDNKCVEMRKLRPLESLNKLTDFTLWIVGGKRGFLAEAEPQLHLVRGEFADLAIGE